MLTASLACLPLAGIAQDLDLAALQELDDDRTEITHENLTIEQIEDLDVARNGEIIGEVEEVLGDQNGEVRALVVEYGGNAVGLGDREIVVPIDEFEFTPGRAVVTLTDDELGEMPLWER